MPPHHCRGSNYLQLSSFWSTVKIRRFSWLHSTAGNSGGISLLLFFLFRGKMRSLRVPHPCITTALSPYYPNPDLLQRRFPKLLVSVMDAPTHETCYGNFLFAGVNFPHYGWTTKSEIHTMSIIFEKVLHIMSSFLNNRIFHLNHLSMAHVTFIDRFLFIYLSSSVSF